MVSIPFANLKNLAPNKEQLCSCYKLVVKSLKNYMQYFNFNSKYNKYILQRLLIIHITNTSVCRQGRGGRSQNKT